MSLTVIGPDTQFTPSEACDYLGSLGVEVSRESVKRWVDIGLLRGSRTASGRRLVSRAELDRLVAERRAA